MADLIIEDKMENFKNQIEENKGTFYELTSKALNVISSAKVLHDKMETYYIENMDFNKVNEKVNYVTEKLESYAESYTSNI